MISIVLLLLLLLLLREACGILLYFLLLLVHRLLLFVILSLRILGLLVEETGTALVAETASCCCWVLLATTGGLGSAVLRIEIILVCVLLLLALWLEALGLSVRWIMMITRLLVECFTAVFSTTIGVYVCKYRRSLHATIKSILLSILIWGSSLLLLW
jgi:hypothetical protein